MITQAVTCDKCGDVFKVDGDEFYTITGNIYIGLTGGLIGDNLDEKRTVIHDVHFCKKCFFRIIQGER